MNTKSFGEIAKWMRDTDLVEVSYKRSGNGFEIRTEEAPVKTNIPECQLVPVVAQAVGIFRMSAPGKSNNISEGSSVKEGDVLGYIEVLKDKKPVTASSSGQLKVICIEDGKPVQYGQPLFFIEEI